MAGARRRTDVESAQRAIDTILEQGEGAPGDWQSAHFGQFVEILDEYRRLPLQNPAFDPGAPDEPISFDKQIKPLFRDRDQQSMKFAFDLWSYDDVKANAQAILERLDAGTMPCDGAWPRERITVFER